MKKYKIFSRKEENELTSKRDCPSPLDFNGLVADTVYR